MGIPDYHTCLLRNIYEGQEAAVRTGHGTIDWFQIRKGFTLYSCLFNFHAEYMWNPGLDVAKRNINNLRYADDTTLMAESKEELKSLLMRVKEETEKAGWKLNIQKTKIMASGLIMSWQIDGETGNSETLFSWAPKSLHMLTAAMKLKDTCSLEEKLWPT